MWLGPFRTRSCYALARAFRHRHHEVVIDDLYLDRPQPHPRIALMLTGLDVEFIAVPGTGDIGLILGERQAQARLVLCDHLLHTRIDLTLTDGSEAGLIGKAASYWGKAGLRLLERSALVEAVAHLTRAI